MTKRAEINVFGLAFMDVISCGLGGMLILMFVFSTMVQTEGVLVPPDDGAIGGTTRSKKALEEYLRTAFVLHAEVVGGTSGLKYLNPNDKIRSLSSKDDGRSTQHIAMVFREGRNVNEFAFRLSVDPSSFRKGSIRLITTKDLTLSIKPRQRNVDFSVKKSGTEYQLICDGCE